MGDSPGSWNFLLCRQPSCMAPQRIKAERLESFINTSSSVRGPASPLREPGRVLAAEVVGQDSRGEPILQIGKQRVAVHSDLPLRQGDRLQVRLEGVGENLSLRVVDSVLKEVHGTLRTLLARTDQQGDLGEAVGRLREVLVGQPRPSRSAAELLQAIQSRVLSGPFDSDGLRIQMERSVVSLESRLFQIAVEGQGPAPREQNLRSTTLQLLQAMTGGAELGRQAFDHFGALFVRTFQAELARAQPDSTGPARTRLERFLASVLSEVLPVLSNRSARNATGVRLRARLLAVLADTSRHAALTGAVAPLLRKLLAETDRGDLKRLRAELGDDLKAQLFRFLGGAGAPEEVERATRLLEILEQEQARNLARADSDAGREWSLLLGPEEQPTMLKVFRRDPHGVTESSRSIHLTVGVDFSQLGPIRAELVFEDSSLSVKLVVESSATLARIHEHSRALYDFLEQLVPRASLTLMQGTAAQVSVLDLEREIPFLSENHLLDLNA